MAKVEINATPKANNKLLDDRALLSRVLKTLGKNDQLLREARDLLDNGHIDKFARYTSALDVDNDYSGVALLWHQEEDVVVMLTDPCGVVVDSVAFDKAEFYANL